MKAALNIASVPRGGSQPSSRSSLETLTRHCALVLVSLTSLLLLALAPAQVNSVKFVPNFTVNPEVKCKEHFVGALPPSHLNVLLPIATCHYKDDEVFFYNIYDEGVLHGSVTVHKVDHTVLSRCTSGRKAFVEDPQLIALGVKQVAPEKPSSGYGTIWNRGHLGPSQMFSWDKSPLGAWTQCYYASNIAPQGFHFNQVGWKFLEANIFDFVERVKHDIFVITGTYYNTTLSSVGNSAKIQRLDSGIGIPDYYYKVVCDDIEGHSAAFAGRNELHHSGMESLNFMTVEEWQKRTGINFHLPEKCRPDRVDPKFWNFTYAMRPRILSIFGPLTLTSNNDCL